MKKKLILGLTATMAVATPVVAVVSCGNQSINSNNATEAKQTWTPDNKSMDELKAKIDELTKQVESLQADKTNNDAAKKLADAQALLSKANEQLANMRTESMASIKASFASALLPYTTNTWQHDHDVFVDETHSTGDAQSYTKGRKATELETKLSAIFQSDFLNDDAFGSEAWIALSTGGFEPITDANQEGAADYATAKLDDNFFTLDDAHKVAYLGDLILGSKVQGSATFRNGGLVQLGVLGPVEIQGSPLAASNGITKVLFSIDETTKTLSVWTKDRFKATLPTLGEEIAKVNPNWKQDAAIVAELTRIGLTADAKMTPENFMKVIKYFYTAPSEAAAAAFEKAQPWANEVKWTDAANGFNVYKKLTSPLSWAFDDYTINNLGLASKQVVKKDGSVKRFDDADFYTLATADQYDSEMWKDQFEQYDGKLVSKGWVFDHIFNGLTTPDGTNDWNNGGANRYHSFFDRSRTSIKFMQNTYKLLVSSHASQENANDQILDFAVQSKGNLKVVYRDSMVLKGMQPDARHMFDGKSDEDFEKLQSVLTKEQATKTISTQEFMDALVKAQQALKSFTKLGSSALNDLFIGNLVNLITTIDLAHIPVPAAEKLLSDLQQKTDINLNLFVKTVNESPSYIMDILVTFRKDNHYALSLMALQFDNVINTMLDIARIASPESFAHGDLSHI